MIKFFRHIRQKLLAKNRFSKYLIYAIGEIILVVIGILIALQINNWNQNRVNSSKEQEYLVGLKNDLEKQISNFKGIDRFYDQVIDIGQSILADYTEKEILTEIDNVNAKLSVMMYAREFPDIRTTFNELNTTGQINLIKEKSLRSNIIKYYQDSESDKQTVNYNIKEVHYNHIFPFIKSSIIILPESYNKTFEKVDSQLLTNQLASSFKDNLNNPSKEFEIVNAISLRIIVAKTNQNSIQSATDKAETLLSELNTALENN